MTRLAELRGQIGSMDELLDIVGAMRSLAGMRLQEAQRALPGIRRYADRWPRQSVRHFFSCHNRYRKDDLNVGIKRSFSTLQSMGLSAGSMKD